jgi:hypothetical protein
VSGEVDAYGESIPPVISDDKDEYPNRPPIGTWPVPPQTQDDRPQYPNGLRFEVDVQEQPSTDSNRYYANATASPAELGAAQPWGVEAILAYNGLVMNDRLVSAETYRITKLHGLDDADVRDAREVNAADHGETPHRALYGGRTIVIEGQIRANNLAKMRAMQQDMRSAFLGLTEAPLYLHMNHDPDTAIYINCRKSGKIEMDESQARMDYWRDFQITLRASDPAFYSMNDVDQGPIPIPNRAGAVGASMFEFVNDGNWVAKPVMSIVGLASTALKLYSEADDSRVMIINYPTSGSLPIKLDIDCQNKTILAHYIDGTTSSRFDLMDWNAQWLELPPGSNVIRGFFAGPLATTFDTSPTILFSARSAWL